MTYAVAGGVAVVTGAAVSGASSHLGSHEEGRPKTAAEEALQGLEEYEERPGAEWLIGQGLVGLVGPLVRDGGYVLDDFADLTLDDVMACEGMQQKRGMAQHFMKAKRQLRRE